MKRPISIHMQEATYQSLRVFAVINKLSLDEAIEKLLELAEKQK